MRLEFGIMKRGFNINIPFCSLLFIALLGGCKQEKTVLRLAVPKNNNTYNKIALDLQRLLNSEQFDLKIVPAENSLAAHKMVTKNMADFAFTRNNSNFRPLQIGDSAKNLRTILPIAKVLNFNFYRRGSTEEAKVPGIYVGRKIYTVVDQGETGIELANNLKAADIHSEVVQDTAQADVFYFWGTFYNPRSIYLLSHGWKLASMDPDYIEFLRISNESIEPFYLPFNPGVPNSKGTTTISSQVLLLGHSDLDEGMIYDLVKSIYDHRIQLHSSDNMYHAIREDYNRESLLYSLHPGAYRYLDRNAPTIWERYADTFALLLSLSAILVSAVQAIRSHLAKKKKDRIDHYFIEFVSIKTNPALTHQQQHDELQKTHFKALHQLTQKKLDKGDFHIFSRLLQAEVDTQTRLMLKEK